jgi:hypothetical protein
VTRTVQTLAGRIMAALLCLSLIGWSILPSLSHAPHGRDLHEHARDDRRSRSFPWHGGRPLLGAARAQPRRVDHDHSQALLAIAAGGELACCLQRCLAAPRLAGWSVPHLPDRATSARLILTARAAAFHHNRTFTAEFPSMTRISRGLEPSWPMHGPTARVLPHGACALRLERGAGAGP